MAQTAAHLVDHVIPHVPVRQWVRVCQVRLPIPLRLLLATQPKLVTPVLQLVHRVITRLLLDQAGLKVDEADSGAVTLIQRFGSAANLNIHLHCLVLDGVCRRSSDGAPVFVEVPGTTPLVMSPLAFMQRLAARVPRPRLHLIRSQGVLAPNAKLRALVVPQEPEPPAPGAPPVECEASCSHHRPVRLSWAKLLKRVFEIDIEHGPNCGGGLKIIAAILEQPVIEKILTPLALQARAPPRAPARGSQLQAA